jgi:subtilisin family serine protease
MTRSMLGLLVCLILVAALGFPSSQIVDAEPAAQPVIVVFRPEVSLEGGRGFFHADDRARANARAWDYLDRGVAGTVQGLEVSHGFRARHVFSHAIRGFSAQLTARQADALSMDPRVESVEADGIMEANVQALPWGINRIDADISPTARANNGTGSVTRVHVYVIDTGIDGTHPDLSVVGHVNFAGGVNTDCHGHGTHVAGTIAARDNVNYVVGVAPGAPLTGVKVLGCSGWGSTSNIIKGVDWVTAHAVRPAVANMSLSGDVSGSLDAAVRNSAQSGVFYALAAGNKGANACNYSPARAASGTNGVMGVGATDSINRDPSWSNVGACVDIWAPGVGILSTRRGGGTTTMSGTSTASPHVAGTAALYLASHPGASASTVEAALKSNAISPATSANNGAPIRLVNAARF